MHLRHTHENSEGPFLARLTQDTNKNEGRSFDMSPVSIVMCTFNGARHLAEQLDSFSSQTLRPGLLIISDDGSDDETSNIIDTYRHGEAGIQVENLDGPRQGYAKNFLNALRHVPADTPFTALADQDDVWFDEKLDRAVTTLRDIGSGPALYGAATLECDADQNPLGMSRIVNVDLGFRHAITQNFAGGNTMVMNNAALEIVQNALKNDVTVQAHDWWLYQIISAAGGQIIFDEEPCMHYRQHGANQVGSAGGISAKVKRTRRMLRNEYRHWNTQNFQALSDARHLMTPENQKVLDMILTARDGSVFTRLSLMRTPKIFRQSLLGQIGLFAALALNAY